MWCMKFFSWLADILFPPKDTERIVRTTTPLALGRLVAPVVLESGVVALLPYRHSLVRAVIIEAKFKRNEKAIALLAGILRDYVDSLQEESAGFTKEPLLLAPVPLGPARMKERGYNQVAEVIRKTGVPMAEDLLIRVRDTAPQTSLKRKERLQNMDGAFQTLFDPNASARHVIVDDVTTTGATLASARSALIDRGISNVLLVALAH